MSFGGLSILPETALSCIPANQIRHTALGNFNSDWIEKIQVKLIRARGFTLKGINILNQFIMNALYI